MTCQLKAKLEERRLDRHQLLKLSEGDDFIKQLVAGVVWKVREDELTWLGHEVVVIELIADSIRRDLPTCEQIPVFCIRRRRFLKIQR